MVDVLTPLGRLIKPTDCRRIEFKGETAVQMENGWRITEVILSPDRTLFLTCKKIKVKPRRVRK